MVAQTEDVALLRLGILVAADALEHAGAVMQRVDKTCVVASAQGIISPFFQM